VTTPLPPIESWHRLKHHVEWGQALPELLGEREDPELLYRPCFADTGKGVVAAITSDAPPAWKLQRARSMDLLDVDRRRRAAVLFSDRQSPGVVVGRVCAATFFNPVTDLPSPRRWDRASQDALPLWTYADIKAVNPERSLPGSRTFWQLYMAPRYLNRSATSACMPM